MGALWGLTEEAGRPGPWPPHGLASLGPQQTASAPCPPTAQSPHHTCHQLPQACTPSGPKPFGLMEFVQNPSTCLSSVLWAETLAIWPVHLPGDQTSPSTSDTVKMEQESGDGAFTARRPGAGHHPPGHSACFWEPLPVTESVMQVLGASGASVCPRKCSVGPLALPGSQAPLCCEKAPGTFG